MSLKNLPGVAKAILFDYWLGGLKRQQAKVALCQFAYREEVAEGILLEWEEAHGRESGGPVSEGMGEEGPGA